MSLSKHSSTDPVLPDEFSRALGPPQEPGTSETPFSIIEATSIINYYATGVNGHG